MLPSYFNIVPESPTAQIFSASKAFTALIFAFVPLSSSYHGPPLYFQIAPLVPTAQTSVPDAETLFKLAEIVLWLQSEPLYVVRILDVVTAQILLESAALILFAPLN